MQRRLRVRLHKRQRNSCRHPGSIQLASCDPGIIAPPIVDSTNHVLYVFYGQDVTNKQGQVAQVVYTATPTFSSGPPPLLQRPGQTAVSIASANSNIDFVAGGAFSRSYFSGFSPASSFLYTCGSNASDESNRHRFAAAQF